MHLNEEEIMKVVVGLKNNKAPGHNSLTAESVNKERERLQKELVIIIILYGKYGKRKKFWSSREK